MRSNKVQGLIATIKVSNFYRFNSAQIKLLFSNYFGSISDDRKIFFQLFFDVQLKILYWIKISFTRCFPISRRNISLLLIEVSESWRVTMYTLSQQLHVWKELSPTEKSTFKYWNFKQCLIFLNLIFIQLSYSSCNRILFLSFFFLTLGHSWICPQISARSLN